MTGRDETGVQDFLAGRGGRDHGTGWEQVGKSVEHIVGKSVGHIVGKSVGIMVGKAVRNTVEKSVRNVVEI